MKGIASVRHKNPTLWTSLLLLCASWCCGPSASLSAMGPERPTLHILAIGPGASADPRIPPLPDAGRAFAPLIQALELQENRLYGRVRVQLLTEPNTSSEVLEHEATAFLRTADPGDLCVILLGTRFAVDTTTGAHFLLLDTSDLSQLHKTALEEIAFFQQLANALNNPVNVLIIYDILGAKATINEAPLFGYPGRAPVRLSTELAAAAPRWLEAHSGWALLGGGLLTYSSDQIEANPEEGSGPTTPTASPMVRYLAQALSSRDADRNRDGRLALIEIFEYLIEAPRGQNGWARLPDLNGRSLAQPLLWAPGDEERCNGVDDDLDGREDEDFDRDRDGYPDMERCPEDVGKDCDDTDSKVFPGQVDLWNGRDDDCDGRADEDEPDLNHNGVPDTLETLLRRSRTLTASGVALLAWSVWTYASLSKVNADPVGEFSLEERETYAQKSWQTIATGGLGGLCLGLSGYFGLRRIERSRIHPFPPVPRTDSTIYPLDGRPK